MALPLPRTVADVGQGGPLITAMNAMNALQNANALREINETKAKYSPWLTQADINSKNAYAALVGLQPLGKILGNEAAYANVPDSQKNAINQRFLAAGGVGQLPFPNAGGGNAINNMPAPEESFLDTMKNGIKNIFSGGNVNQAPQSNPMANMQRPMAQSAPNDGIDHDLDAAYMDWMNSPEARNGKAPVPSPEVLKARFAAKNGEPTVSLEVSKKVPGKTFAEKAGEFKGIVEEGKESGGLRAKDIDAIGQQQLQLSNSGANLDRIIEDINDPKFISLRNKFPFYQDMQLTALSKIGTPEEQEMIGNFLGDIKSYIGATVSSFKGATLKREFDYANELKPNEKDTVNSIRGKVGALKALKEVAEKKNEIISDLMEKKHMSLSNAVKFANKQIDIKSIDKQVKAAIEPKISLTNHKTGETRIVTLSEARKLGVPNV